ncbi:unnamed protein product [Moneuplotes crassus]|uniref:Uncharacterized protein n=1 Tax=Euplotes crassus TaxID=5936 RepID=A0AAD2D8K1_EUPCR|nr:unnamed protein product [Moneuplotes crassus]
MLSLHERLCIINFCTSQTSRFYKRYHHIIWAESLNSQEGLLCDFESILIEIE